MTAAEELRDVLTGDAALAAMVTAVRADLAIETDAYPFIVFKRVGIEPLFGLDNTLHLTKETFQVECWGEHRSQSSDIAELAIAALIAAGMPPSPSDPDAIDPEIGARAVVLNVEIFDQ